MPTSRRGTSKFDLTLFAAESGRRDGDDPRIPDRPVRPRDHASDAAATTARFSRASRAIPDRRVSELAFLTDEERDAAVRALAGRASCALDQPSGHRRADRGPRRIGAARPTPSSAAGRTLTYRQLARESDSHRAGTAPARRRARQAGRALHGPHAGGDCRDPGHPEGRRRVRARSTRNTPRAATASSFATRASTPLSPRPRCSRGSPAWSGTRCCRRPCSRRPHVGRPLHAARSRCATDRIRDLHVRVDRGSQGRGRVPPEPPSLDRGSRPVLRRTAHSASSCFRAFPSTAPSRESSGRWRRAARWSSPTSRTCGIPPGSVR